MMIVVDGIYLKNVYVYVSKIIIVSWCNLYFNFKWFFVYIKLSVFFLE